MQSDIFFMQEALLEARKAFTLNEVPVGAVLVYKEEIIASSHNCVESFQDSSAHAEMLVLQEGAKKIGNWRDAGHSQQRPHSIKNIDQPLGCAAQGRRRFINRNRAPRAADHQDRKSVV